MDIVPFAESTILILFLYEKCDNYKTLDKNTLSTFFLTISLSTWGNEFIFYIIDKFQKNDTFYSYQEMGILRKLNHFSNLHEMTKIIINNRDIHFLVKFGNSFFSQFWKSLCHKLDNNLEFSCFNHVQNHGKLHVIRDFVHHSRTYRRLWI